MELLMKQNQIKRMAKSSLICGIFSLFFPLPWLILLYDYNVTNWFTTNFDWLVISFGILIGIVLGSLAIVFGVKCKKQIQIEQGVTNHRLYLTGTACGAIAIIGGLSQTIVASSVVWCYLSGIC
jgi:hypothetical protein